MVLWEITLGTAYFLGLRRTYRLALKIQRRLITPQHPKIRQIAQRRTRAVFDVVLNVHRTIQQRDIEVGRNLGNWILRWLDRMQPSAQIRTTSEIPRIAGSTSMAKQMRNIYNLKTQQRSGEKGVVQESVRNLLSRRGPWLKPFPTIALIMRPPYSWTNIQYRQLTNGPAILKSTLYGKNGVNGVFRDDIRWWMLRN